MPSSVPDARQRAWLALESLADAPDAPPQPTPLAEACGLTLDLSRSRVPAVAWQALFDLGRAADLQGWRQAMFEGGLVNPTEGRAARHVALRWPVDSTLPGSDGAVLAEVESVRARMAAFSESVREGQWLGFDGQPIDRIVNIGIGGSDLGPAMVCRALDALASPRLRCDFVSNLDSNHLASVLEHCDPARTLFLIASKTFSTQETLTNARSARAWLMEAAGGDEDAVARHFVALSTAHARCAEFGIPAQNVFEFWDWVGGRYSLWSAIGLSIALYLGMDILRRLQLGAHAMDRHFLEAPEAENLPVLLALNGLWHRNVRARETLAVLPYDHALELFPAFLQQLEMESNGKGVERSGEPLARPAAPVIWGALGNNGQHAFYQLLHQGLDTIPVDMIVAARSQRALPGHESAVLANALAQAEALAHGRSLARAREELEGRGVAPEEAAQMAPHLVIPGARPVTVLLYDRLTPEVLGALIALYEHKVFVQAVCWGINPFDQFGVELGKALAGKLEPRLAAGDLDDLEPETAALIRRIRDLQAAP